MLCKKCKTAISENDRKCAYCGSKQKNIKTVMGVLICIIAMLIMSSASYIYWYSTTHSELEPDNIVADNYVDVEIEDAIDSIPEKEHIPPYKDGETILKETEELTPQAFDTETELLLKEALMNVVNYYNNNADTSLFITKRGYMYDEVSEEYVSLKDTQISDNIYFLYINSKHIGEEESNGLTIYTVYEDTDSFIVLGERGNVIKMPREDFRELIDLYDYDHGEIVRPNETDQQAVMIIDAISSYEFAYEGYDIRYLAHDEKYAVATVSFKSDTSTIYEYVLEKYSGQWVVRVPNLETFINVRKKINTEVPDLNMDLLPSFDLQNFIGTYVEDFTHIDTIMESFIDLTEDEIIVFQSGVEDFVYREYSSDRRIVFARSEGDGWLVLEVSDWKEAEAKMEELSSEPPLFLIRQR